MRLVRPPHSGLRWPPDILKILGQIYKALLLGLYLLLTSSKPVLSILATFENILEPVVGWTAHIGARKLLCKSKFPVPTFFILVIACMVLPRAITEVLGNSSAIVWNGGPRQALAFHGTDTALVFPMLRNETNTTFTLEFWVQSRCAGITCAHFTLQNGPGQEFSYVHRDSVFCFGERFSIVDGQIPGILSPIDWNLYGYSSEWHHFAFVANSALGTCRVFIDAKLLVHVESGAWLASPQAGPAFFRPTARLVLGQLVIEDYEPLPRYSFQGSIDEIRLWQVDRSANITSTMFRGLVPPYSTDLVAYWNMDMEQISVLSSIAFEPTLMVVSDATYVLGGPIRFGFPQRAEVLPRFSTAIHVVASTIVYSPSTAPIVTEYYNWLIHVNSSLDARNPFQLRYLCIDQISDQVVDCPLALVNQKYLPVAGDYPTGSFPKAGRLYAYNESGQATALLPAQNSTTSTNWAYESIPFLITGRFDGFRWQIGNSAEGGSVDVYGAPLTTYSPYNTTLVYLKSRPPLVLGNTFLPAEPIPLFLSCGSWLGDEVQAAVITSPAQGQLFQADVRPSSATGSLEFYPTKQITQCVNPASPDGNCLVSHFTNVVLYQPIVDPLQNGSVEVSFIFVCTSPHLDGTSQPQNFTFVITVPTDTSNEVSYSSSQIGPNPYALSFDGSLSRLRAATPQAYPVKAISLWVKPSLNPSPLVMLGSHLEQQTLIQMLHSNNTPEEFFAIRLLRNSSSYPNFFVAIENYDPATLGYRTLIAYNNSASSFISPGEWTNIVVTYYPGQNTYVGIYFNGSPIASASIGTIEAPEQVYVGSLQSKWSQVYSGVMDDVTLWKSPLGAFDILNIQSENLLPDNPDLLAHWGFNEGLGYQTIDAVMGWTLTPSPNAPAFMPLWVPAGSALSFSSIETSLSSPQVVTLPISASANVEKWRFGTYLTKLPTNGMLYQYSVTSKKQLNLSPSALDRIYAPFTETGFVMPEQVRLWASGVQSWSSSRKAPYGTVNWSALHIVGPPSWWKADGSAMPVYGDSPQSWCPQPDCIANPFAVEWITVKFNEALYLTGVEVFQNLNPGVITKLSAWDETAQTWRSVYDGKVKLASSQYATFTPLFCSISTFKTMAIRVEMRPCLLPGWHEIEAIRIIGTRTLPPGVVSDPLGRVVYMPDPMNPGLDVISYTASQCPFTIHSAVPSFSYSLKLAAGTATPMSTPGTLDASARGLTLLKLPAHYPDPGVTNFQRVISKFPSRGTLYDAVDGGDDTLRPGAAFSTTGPALVSNIDGYIFYLAPSKCKHNLTSFEYYVSAQGQISYPATITVNSLCKASYLNYTRWLSILLLILTLAAIAYALMFGFFTFLKRKKKSFEEDRPFLLLIIAAGVLLAYASLFFEFAPYTVAYCLARMWILHLGCIIVVAGSLAFTLLVWNDFSLQSLRSNSSKKVAMSSIVLPVIAVIIEIILLIVFSATNTPTVSHTYSPSNGAIQVATCKDSHFSSNFILLNTGAWVFAIFIITTILLSVSLTAVRSAVVMLASSLIGLLCGVIFIVSLSSVKDPDVRLLLRVISLIIPFSTLLSLLLVGKFSSLVKPAVVETTEFGLQTISSPQKSSSRPKTGMQHSETAANVQMTRGMNNHSVDKSVNALLDTVQDKEREIALLKRKLLKRHYRIRELQQKLSDTVEGSQMMYSQAAPSDYGDDYAE